MSVSTLRGFWALIEGMQATTLLRLNDVDLVRQLLVELERESWVDADEISSISTYIRAKLPLIRDLAQARLA